MLGCDTPGQSLAVALVSGGLAGGVGLAADLGVAAVVVLAAAAALGGEVIAHAARGDDGWRTILTRLSRTGPE